MPKTGPIASPFFKKSSQSPLAFPEDIELLVLLLCSEQLPEVSSCAISEVFSLLCVIRIVRSCSAAKTARQHWDLACKENQWGS